MVNRFPLVRAIASQAFNRRGQRASECTQESNHGRLLENRPVHDGLTTLRARYLKSISCLKCIS